MSYSIPCKKCGKPFTKTSNKSTEVKCGDCIYGDIFSKSRNAHAAIANNELTKKQILNKLDRMEKKLKEFDTTLAMTIQSQLTEALNATMKVIADKAALEHSQEFIDLKVGIETKQGEHEARMKTLLATVNTRAISSEKKVQDELDILSARVRDLRRLASKNGWSVAPSRSAVGTKIKD
jgi:DNA-directed RNA polymerase subunit RPC12/RpoP